MNHISTDKGFTVTSSEKMCQPKGPSEHSRLDYQAVVADLALLSQAVDTCIDTLKRIRDSLLDLEQSLAEP